MATKTFYIKDATASGSSWGSLQDGGSAPATATTGTGWIVGTTVITRYSICIYNTKRLASTFASVALPGTTLGTTDGFRTELPINGSFASGNWTFTIPVIAVTAGASGAGAIRVSVWRSANPTGAGGTQIVTAAQLSTVTNITTATAQNSTGTVALPAFSAYGEYIFVAIAWRITTASASASADILLRTGSTATVVTTTYTDNYDNASVYFSTNQASTTFHASPVIQATTPSGEPRSFRDVKNNHELVIVADIPSSSTAVKTCIVKSPDNGVTWSYIDITGVGMDQYSYLISCAQDSSGNVHALFFNIPAGNVQYCRIALSYTAGAITGASISAFFPLPSTYNVGFTIYGAMQVGLDQSGTECLCCAIVDDGNGTGGVTFRIQMLKTLTITPAVTADFTKLDGTAGATVAYTSGTLTVSNERFGLAQCASTKDYWLAFGDSIFTGTVATTAPSRIQVSTSGSHTWSVGAAVNTTAVTSTFIALAPWSTGVDMLNISSTDGLCIDRIASTGTYTRKLQTVDSTASRFGNGSLTTSTDGTRFGVIYSTYDTGQTTPLRILSYYDGTGWTKQADAAVTFANNKGIGGIQVWDNGCLAITLNSTNVISMSSVWYTLPVVVSGFPLFFLGGEF